MLQDWLLALVTDTTQVGNEVRTRELLTALVEQLAMYCCGIRDKSFYVVVTGQVLTMVTINSL
jgi:hypothetical protein